MLESGGVTQLVDTTIARLWRDRLRDLPEQPTVVNPVYRAMANPFEGIPHHQFTTMIGDAATIEGVFLSRPASV